MQKSSLSSLSRKKENKMKKVLTAVLIFVGIFCTSCSQDEDADKQDMGDFFNRRVLVENSSFSRIEQIIMDSNTGVLYYRDFYDRGIAITPIYDSDGSVMTYEKYFEKYLAKKAEKNK